MPQLVGEIYMDLMRVYQTAGLIPQRLLFFLAVFADVHNLRRLVNAFAVFEDWNEKFAHGVGARCEVCLLPGLDRVEEQKGILLIELFIHETDQICDNLASLLVIDSLDGVNDASVSFMMQKMTIDADDARFDEIMKEVVEVCKKVEPDCIINM